MDKFEISNFVVIEDVTCTVVTECIICECGDTFPTEAEFEVHYNEKHGEKSDASDTSEQERIPSASPIDESYEEGSGVKKHESFCCEQCGQAFASTRSVNMHTAHMHSDRRRGKRNCTPKPKKAVCKECGSSYVSQTALRYHVRTHTGERPFHCPECPKRFTMPTYLQFHLRRHTGEKPYACEECGKAFPTNAALIRHSRVHTGEKPYSCPECGKAFTQSNDVKLHVRTVHMKLPAPYKSKSRKKKEAAALEALRLEEEDEQQHQWTE